MLGDREKQAEVIIASRRLEESSEIMNENKSLYTNRLIFKLLEWMMLLNI